MQSTEFQLLAKRLFKPTAKGMANKSSDSTNKQTRPSLKRSLTLNRPCCFEQDGRRKVGIVHVHHVYNTRTSLVESANAPLYSWVFVQDKHGTVQSKKIRFSGFLQNQLHPGPCSGTSQPSLPLLPSSPNALFTKTGGVPDQEQGAPQK